MTKQDWEAWVEGDGRPCAPPEVPTPLVLPHALASCDDSAHVLGCYSERPDGTVLVTFRKDRKVEVQS